MEKPGKHVQKYRKTTKNDEKPLKMTKNWE